MSPIFEIVNHDYAGWPLHPAREMAVILIALGDKRAREVLADLALDTVDSWTSASAAWGKSAAEKASVMLEFAHFFSEGSPILGNPAKQKRRPTKGKGAGAPMGGPAKPPPIRRRRRQRERPSFMRLMECRVRPT